VGPIAGTTPSWTDRLTVGRNIRNLTWTCVIALHITGPSSRQRELPARKRKKVIVTQRNLTSGHPLQKGPDTKTNWPTDRRSQYSLTWTCVIALQITDPSSRQRGHPTWRRKSNCHLRKCKILLSSPKGPDTKTNWPTDRQSQYNLTWTQCASGGYRNVLLMSQIMPMHLDERE
jgi:hypothetical protein